MPGLVRCTCDAGSGCFEAAAAGASDDADQNRGSNYQDAVDRVEFACHEPGFPCERCDAERPNAKPMTTGFTWVIWI
jgi:hypothetical protein